ncbi:hypothetical protein Hdeb2414_s0029g00705761 [Helianthus debilis subsp. tardiflorus]
MKIHAEVDALVGQTAAFKIDVTSYVLKYSIHKYGILKLTVDPNVISQLQDKQSSSQITVCYINFLTLLVYVLNILLS